MTQPLTIDFVSDIACPWCAIGLSSLQRALSRLGDAVDAQIVVHPFELNPDMGPEGETIVDYLGKNMGVRRSRSPQTQAVIRERGASVGFDFGPRTRVYNTFDAHRLLHWAGIEGKQLPLKLALLRAYHADGKDPSNHEVLVEAAQSVGLDADRRHVTYCKTAPMPTKFARKNGITRQWASSRCRPLSSTAATW